MQMFREVVKAESEELVIHLPKEFRKKKVEVIVFPLNIKGEKKYSKEVENFLNLGGSGCWEGNLAEMRESRNGIS
ncbi:MAG: hypothetical protein MUF15_23395 [Acidobacteria bacterium]|jgi:hypothetical protein|nr:hypothetical protein [Acidobacteriota bacterium]